MSFTAVKRRPRSVTGTWQDPCAKQYLFASLVPPVAGLEVGATQILEICLYLWCLCTRLKPLKMMLVNPDVNGYRDQGQVLYLCKSYTDVVRGDWGQVQKW